MRKRSLIALGLLGFLAALTPAAARAEKACARGDQRCAKQCGAWNNWCRPACGDWNAWCAGVWRSWPMAERQRRPARL